MKHGDLVTVNWTFPEKKPWGNVICIALEVTKEDIRRGTNVLKPGLYLFRGYWYGKDPFSINSYGKIEGSIGKRIGRAKNHSQVRRLLRGKCRK